MEPGLPPLRRPAEPLPAKTEGAPWWGDHQVSGWERIWGAFHRDWEQTKADFSVTTAHDLRQTAGDTLKQASGDASLPRPRESTRPATAEGAARAKQRLLAESEKAEAAVTSARNAITDARTRLRSRTHEIEATLARQYARADENLSEATLGANQSTQQAQGRVREALRHYEDAHEEWIKAEREASYGYAARAHYLQFPNWSPELEDPLRGERITAAREGSWDDARAGVRQGWDLERRQP